MSAQYDGGQAFPMHKRDDALAGMSLRDYFAAKALSGELASQSLDGVSYSGSEALASLAEFSYEVADAMLKARKQ